MVVVVVVVVGGGGGGVAVAVEVFSRCSSRGSSRPAQGQSKQVANGKRIMDALMEDNEISLQGSLIESFKLSNRQPMQFCRSRFVETVLGVKFASSCTVCDLPVLFWMVSQTGQKGTVVTLPCEVRFASCVMSWRTPCQLPNSTAAYSYAGSTVLLIALA